jgi:hypothetical protein
MPQLIIAGTRTRLFLAGHVFGDPAGPRESGDHALGQQAIGGGTEANRVWIADAPQVDERGWAISG